MSRALPVRRASFLAAVACLAACSAVLGGSRPAAGAVKACPDVNRPNMLAIVAGSSQTAQVGKPFQTNLQVALANTNGCPLTGLLAGISVDFVAPTSAASGTFATSDTNVAVVGTDAQGVAVAPQFTANGTAGAYSVHAESDYGTVKLYLTNTATGVAASLAASGQTAQSAQVLARYGAPLQAQVLDANGQPVQGASVTFSLGVGTYGAGASFAGGGAQATELTDATGTATSPPFTANGVAGRFTATATTESIVTPIAYALDNLAAHDTLAATRAAAQTATVDHRYGRPLRVLLRDDTGQPIEGATVTFTLGSAAAASQGAAGAGATFAGGGTQATDVTDASGLATSPAVVANATAGRFTATAASVGVRPVSFSFRNVAGAPTTITAGAAASEATTAGSRFPVRLAVTVTDAHGNAVPGAVVTFRAPTHGPSGGFVRPGRRAVRVRTDASGVAVAPVFVANRRAGGYAVTASVKGSARAAAFALVNGPRAR